MAKSTRRLNIASLSVRAFRKLFWTIGGKSFGTAQRRTLNLLQGLTLILSGLDD
jgi:hypothetical protein